MGSTAAFAAQTERGSFSPESRHPHFGFGAILSP
jgi:hypothetical protein